jgi:hypothetical protein
MSSWFFSSASAMDRKARSRASAGLTAKARLASFAAAQRRIKRAV